MLGIIPCGGKATRMNGISKWMLPTPHGTLIDVLISRMQLANPRQIVIMSKGLNTLLLDEAVPPDVEVIHRHDQSMSHAVMLAREYVEPGEGCIFGMPDTYFEDDKAFVKLAHALEYDGVHVAVGLFRTRPGQHRKLGMCRVENGLVREVIDKPEETNLEWAWGALAWKQSFWFDMNASDPHVGYALPRALESGLVLKAVHLEGSYYDCGTYTEYAELIRSFEAVTHGA